MALVRASRTGRAARAAGSAEAGNRPLERDNPGELAAVRPDGSRDRVEALLALLVGVGPAAALDELELGLELPHVRDRPLRVGAERPSGLGAREREHHLSGGGRVRDRRATEVRCPLDVLRRAHHVDGHRVGVARDGQRRRLAGLGDERLEMRVGDDADVEPGEHRRSRARRAGSRAGTARWLRTRSTRPDSTSVPSCRDTVLAVAPDPAGDLVRPERRLGGEHIEDARARCVDPMRSREA